MTFRRHCSALSLALLVAIVWAVPSQAHGGGTPRLTGEQAGPYRVYAWSEPQPLRQGETHLTIGITIPNVESDVSAEDEKPVTDADVKVVYTAVDGGAEPVVMPAEPQESLGIVYYEADGVLPAAGLWRAEVAVQGTEGKGVAAFEADVSPARRINSTVVAIAGAILVIGLLALAWRARRGDSSLPRTLAPNK